MASKADLTAAAGIVLVVSEAIREAGEIPEGELYALLMGKMDIHGFQSLVRLLTRTGLVRSENHLLTWIGPMKGMTKEETK